MNYLAHLLLSGPDVEVAVGNFIGDGVKGRIPEELSSSMKMGLKLHRFIDSYADAHPVNQEIKILLHPHFHKYAGVVLDMYHDHLLAVNWGVHGEGEIAEFIDGKFAAFEPYLDHFPKKVLRLYHGMKEGDWLLNYRHFEGLERSFQGLAKRTTFESNMATAVDVLKEKYEVLTDSFNSYFPDIQREAVRHRVDLLTTL